MKKSLTDKFITYLEKHSSDTSQGYREKWITQKELKEAAAAKHYPRETIQTALKALDSRMNIGNCWDGEQRQVVYMYYHMTEEEMKKRQDDLDWFNSLPG